MYLILIPCWGNYWQRFCRLSLFPVDHSFAGQRLFNLMKYYFQFLYVLGYLSPTHKLAAYAYVLKVSFMFLLGVCKFQVMC